MVDVVEVRRRLADPITVVAQLGLERGARRERGGVRVLCPVHREREPSCSVSVGRDETIRVHCWSCGWSGDVLHLVGAANGLDLRVDFRRVASLAADLAGVEADRGLMRPARPRPVAVQLAFRMEIATADHLAGLEVRADEMIEGATAEQIDEALALLAELDRADIVRSIALDLVGDETSIETMDGRRLAGLATAPQRAA